MAAYLRIDACISGTDYAIAGVLAFIIALVLAYFGKSLLFVAVSSCVVVFVTELLIRLFVN